LVEQLPFKQTVAGSNPARGTTNERSELCPRSEPTAWLVAGFERLFDTNWKFGEKHPRR